MFGLNLKRVGIGYIFCMRFENIEELSIKYEITLSLSLGLFNAIFFNKNLHRTSRRNTFALHMLKKG